MVRRLRGMGPPKNFWLTLLVLGAWPALAPAAWLGFRNDTSIPVVVQAASVVKNEIHWGKSHLLYPGEVSWDCVAQPSTKPIIIFDGKKRVLLQGSISCDQDDLFFSVRLLPTGQARLL